LFVCASHAAVALPRICKKALWLEQGELVMSGTIDDVLRAYKDDAHGVQIRLA
jgi:ABC-type polysaccharide/polyol phosphate transport system ATPase subunit